MSRQNKQRNLIWRFIAVIYCAVMVWLLFFRSAGWVDGLSYQQQLQHNINLTPFYTIGNYWNVIVHRTNEAVRTHCIINLTGNVILFVPAGYLLPKLWPRQRNYFLFFVTCLGIMFMVEVLQLFSLLGCFDVDDLILNLIGMTFGFIVFHLFRKSS